MLRLFSELSSSQQPIRRMKLLNIFICGLFSLGSCQSEVGTVNQKDPVNSTVQLNDDVNLIPVDSANKMIESYLVSIDYAEDSLNLRSLILDAETLRDFLEDEDISKVKIMFAHTLEYINEGNHGVPASYNSGKLTMVIAGYDSKNDYVYNPAGVAINRMMACPPNCPESGSASSDLLQ